MNTLFHFSYNNLQKSLLDFVMMVVEMDRNQWVLRVALAVCPKCDECVNIKVCRATTLPLLSAIGYVYWHVSGQGTGGAAPAQPPRHLQLLVWILKRGGKSPRPQCQDFSIIALQLNPLAAAISSFCQLLTWHTQLWQSSTDFNNASICVKTCLRCITIQQHAGNYDIPYS